MFDCPWSTNQLKKLSRYIRDGTDAPSTLPTYQDVMLWYDDVAAQVQTRISALDWTPFLGVNEPLISSRAKTIDTLRQKLLRDPSTPLPSVQDVAGVRLEAEMSLDEQDAIARAIAQHFSASADAIKDLRKTPHSGYRAVHLWLRLPVRVEVQIRTHLQGAWANAYEAAADVFGRDIRYGVVPEDPEAQMIVTGLQELSVGSVAGIEQARNRGAQAKLVMEEMVRRGIKPDDNVQELWEEYVAQESVFKSNLEDLRDQFRRLRGRM